MAFSVKIQGIPRDHGAPIWCVDAVSWWPERRLTADPRFREVYSPGYLDYVAVLSLDEARTMAAAYRKDAGGHLQEESDRLDELLASQRPTTCWVLVVVSEWESGLS